MTRHTRVGKSLAALAFLMLLPAVTFGQTGTIAGVVRDTTGAVLPGVTVEASSPALIERVRTVATDERGQYKIIDLRPGVYTVTFTLAGFSTVQREGIELTASFTAPVNAEMRVGAVAETITVSGQTPIVDTQRVVQQQVMTRDIIDTVPTGKTFQNFGVLIPGVVLGGGGTGATPYDVGGSSGEQQVQMAIHGGNTQDMVIQIDGLRFNVLCGSGSYTGISGNDALMEQISFETGAISAEMGTGGIRINMIPKEGGNTFKGSFFLNGTTDDFQSDNLTAALQQRGLTAVNTTKKVWDINGSIGGPIRRDRLWFFFASRYWGVDKYAADSFYDADPLYYAYAPDRSRRGVDDSWNLSNALRLTWQATQRNKFTFYYDLQDRVTGHWFVGQGGIFGLTTPEASWIQDLPYGPHLAQARWVSTASNRLLVEAGVSIFLQEYDRLPQPEVSANAFSVSDVSTGRRINAAPYYSQHWTKLRNYLGSVSYVTGSHAFKAGFNLTEGPSREKATVNNDMTLVFSGATPVQAIQTASPRDARDRLNADLGIYAQDQWTVDRLTLNLAIRFDYLNAMLEDQHFPAGTFVPARDLGAISDLPSWKDLGPRLGVAYDLFGNSKTALKTSLSRYVASQTVGFARQFNPFGGTVTGAGFTGAGSNTFVWTDANSDKRPQLSELTNPSNLSFGKPTLTTTPSEDVQKGWFKRGYNWEYSASVQHELMPRVSVGAAYFRRWFGNFTHTDALRVGPGHYDPYCITAPVDGRLPTSGQPVCGLFDVQPSYRGLLSIDRVVDFADSSRRSQVFNGVDLTVSVRLSNTLLLGGGTSTGRTATKNCETFDSPDVRFCEVTPPFLTQVKMLAAYTLPYDLQVSGTFQSFPGPALAANWSINNAIANAGPQPLGRNLAAGRAVVALIEPGTLYGDRLNQVDFRLAKTFRANRSRIQLMLDLYNALNASPVLTYNNTFGGEWQRPTDVLQGRLFKFGGQVTF